MSMYDSLAQSILENLGGASNIARLTHSPASVGIIEPALYGVTLKRRKVFIITCIVSCLTGIGMTVTGVRAYRFAGFGIFGYAAYASPQMDDSRGVMLAVLWSIFALVLSFVLVYFLNREDDPSEQKRS